MRLKAGTVSVLIIGLMGCSWFNKPTDCSNEDAQKIVTQIITEQTEENYKKKSRSIDAATTDIIKKLNLRYEFARPTNYDAPLKKSECSATAQVILSESQGLTDLNSRVSQELAEIEKMAVGEFADLESPFYKVAMRKFLKNHGLKEVVDLGGVTFGDHVISKEIRYTVQETDNKNIYVEVGEWQALADATTILMAMNIFNIARNTTAEELAEQEKYVNSREGQVDSCVFAQEEDFGLDKNGNPTEGPEATTADAAKWRKECEASIPK